MSNTRLLAIMAVVPPIIVGLGIYLFVFLDRCHGERCVVTFGVVAFLAIIGAAISTVVSLIGLAVILFNRQP
ncbi:MULTISPECIES: hypothetical protein [unclassified Mesorhizobium]|uniref:hypothetical protein n=1 Tax=unclassified Mesorhizobium TaxID=325217 RepID=UPI000FCBF2B9|nr:MULTISPECIES: hypothetical protein [unclassified Mesorhizobium]RUV35430.1 hypothetical protein EOB49_21365 [Mesorhizobium sp. M7A.F.Ca.MR.148.00.0.0]RWN45479.1 MAG: hypothetical protein EOS03_21815 [Mesorhizobium sp.]